MPFRKYVNPDVPTPFDLEGQQRHIQHLNQKFAELFPAGSDPWSWKLPSGNTVEQATAIELLNTGSAIMGLAIPKRDQAVVDVTKVADRIYAPAWR